MGVLTEDGDRSCTLEITSPKFTQMVGKQRKAKSCAGVHSLACNTVVTCTEKGVWVPASQALSEKT